MVTLHQLAVRGAGSGDDADLPSDEPLARSVDEAVPAAERLPTGADENPISEQVEEAGRERSASSGQLDPARRGRQRPTRNLCISPRRFSQSSPMGTS